MRPLKRRPVKKGRSAHMFKKHMRRTKRANLSTPVQRGGIRF